jgi:hypothetical protein
MLPSNSSDADPAWRKAINKPVLDSRFERRQVISSFALFASLHGCNFHNCGRHRDTKP